MTKALLPAGHLRTRHEEPLFSLTMRDRVVPRAGQSPSCIPSKSLEGNESSPHAKAYALQSFMCYS